LIDYVLRLSEMKTIEVRSFARKNLFDVKWVWWALERFVEFLVNNMKGNVNDTDFVFVETTEHTFLLLLAFTTIF